MFLKQVFFAFDISAKAGLLFKDNATALFPYCLEKKIVSSTEKHRSEDGGKVFYAKFLRTATFPEHTTEDMGHYQEFLNRSGRF